MDKKKYYIHQERGKFESLPYKIRYRFEICCLSTPKHVIYFKLILFLIILFKIISYHFTFTFTSYIAIFLHILIIIFQIFYKFYLKSSLTYICDFVYVNLTNNNYVNSIIGHEVQLIAYSLTTLVLLIISLHRTVLILVSGDAQMVMLTYSYFFFYLSFFLFYIILLINFKRS